MQNPAQGADSGVRAAPVFRLGIWSRRCPSKSPGTDLNPAARDAKKLPPTPLTGPKMLTERSMDRWRCQPNRGFKVPANPRGGPERVARIQPVFRGP